LNWIDFAGALKAAFGGKAPIAKIIHVSVDALNHNGWSMDYMGLPPIDLEVLAEPDAILAPLLEELGSTSGQRQTEFTAAQDGTALKRLRPRTGSPAALEQSQLDIRQLANCLGSALGEHRVSLIRTPLGWPSDSYDFGGPLDYLGYDGGAGIGSGPAM